jgi:monoterpene epsilon-lactone hydrolase
VICPEYALLPEHTFPVALDQITDVYCSLVNGDAVSQLGFEVSKIVVTGESAGGNLAAALCVKLGMRQNDLEDECEEALLDENYATRLPDAIMLSCAALNLSLELSLSRVIGTQDPVLPSALISAISDAYLPPEQGVSKQNPLASPFFASDRVLRIFPPTLLFAGSSDPLLDDSVDFNERLRCLGVKSELRAAQNMPHAYWGLGTAGFPEAQQVQQECQEWLAKQFTAP